MSETREFLRYNGKQGITREEWASIPWGSKAKPSGSDGWNRAARIEGAFRSPDVVEVLSAPASGTGLYSDALVRLTSGERVTRRSYH